MRTVLLSTFLFCTGAAAAPVPKELRSGSQIEGTWEVVTMHSMGAETTTYRGAKWKIGRDSIDIEYPEAIRAQFPNVSNRINRVERSAKIAQLDYTNYQGNDRLAIYTLDQDKLTLCIPLTVTERPKGFVAHETNLLYTFRRIKE